MIEYNKFAKYYDLIHNEKDYKGEVERVSQLISKFKKSPGNKLLDVACGTGQHTKFLKKDYSVEGLELCKDMLEIARKKNPKVTFHEDRMESFKLGKKFDITENRIKSWEIGQRPIQGWFERIAKDFDKDNILEEKNVRKK